jgi:purine nucleosidase
MATPIILDCDPGIDDALAIAFAHGHPGIDLLGITTVAGNVGLAKTTANALAVSEYVGAAGTPVTAGCAGPLLRPAYDARDVHGESGLGGAVLPAAAGSPAPGHAIEYIIDTVRAAPGQITLVATGPLTNIALAVKREPRLADWVREFVIMGGSAGRGNVTPAAEFNIWADPEAAAVVFRAGWTVVVLGLDVTLRTGASPAVLRRMGDLGPLGTQLLLPALEQYKSVREPSGPPVHDVCAVAWVAQPGLFGLVPARVQVETAGQLTSGMTVIDFVAAGAGAIEADGGNARVAMSIDVDGFWELTLGTYQRVAGAMAPRLRSTDEVLLQVQLFVPAYGLLRRFDQVSVVPLLAGAPGRGQRHDAGLAPYGQAAADGQDRLIAGRLVVTDQPAAEPPLVQHDLEFPGGLARAEPIGGPGRGDVGRERVRAQAGHVHQPGVGQRRGYREPDRLAAQSPAVQPGPGGVVSPAAAGQLVHDLQPAPADGLGGHPGYRWWRAVSPAAVAVKDLADQLAPDADAAQVQPELGLGGPGRRRGLRAPGHPGRPVALRDPRGPAGPQVARTPVGVSGRAGGRDRLALHVRHHGREPIPPSAGLGHRLRMQGVGREFAGHQDAIVEEVSLKADLRDRVPERLPRDCRARGVGRKRPRVARPRVDAPPTAGALLPYTWRH